MVRDYSFRVCRKRCHFERQVEESALVGGDKKRRWCDNTCAFWDQFPTTRHANWQRIRGEKNIDEQRREFFCSLAIGSPVHCFLNRSFAQVVKLQLGEAIGRINLHCSKFCWREEVVMVGYLGDFRECIAIVSVMLAACVSAWHIPLGVRAKVTGDKVGVYRT